MNWIFNENPAEDGTYVLARYVPQEAEWSFYGGTFYTVRGGWNTFYDTEGTFHGTKALATENWNQLAWTTEEDFTASMKGDIESALEAQTASTQGNYSRKAQNEKQNDTVLQL